MLHEFLTSNRQILIGLCRDKVAQRFEPTESPAMVDHGVPLFLQQLVETLRDEKNTPIRSVDSHRQATTEIGRAAALHGAELLRRGFTVDQWCMIMGMCANALPRWLSNRMYSYPRTSFAR